MNAKLLVLIIFAVTFASTQGVLQCKEYTPPIGNENTPTNYDISRNRQLGAGSGYGYPNYGNYPSNYPNQGGLYPSGPSYGQYPGSNYPGNYNPGVVGAPGAHPGCPLCDSSVYSYCSSKQAHDACCCENSAYRPFSCRKANCKFLHANSCQEYQLISSCCCVDLQKSGANRVIPVAPVIPVVG